MWFSSAFKLVLYSTMLGSIVALFILMFKMLIGNKLGVRWNYWVWVLLLIRLLIPYAPQTSLSMFNILNFSNSANSQIKQLPESFFSKTTSELNKTKPEINTSKVSQNGQLQTDIESQDSTNKVAPSNRTTGGETFLFKLLSIIWLLGVLILLTFAIFKTMIFYYKLINQKSDINEEYTQALIRCKEKMGIKTKVSILKTNLVKSPALFGSIKPKLLLPISIGEQVSMEELEFIILHELAHLKRKDISVSYIINALRIVHWFNPILWYSFYRMHEDSELACDALALSYIDSKDCVGYGKTIIKLLEVYKKSNGIHGMEGIVSNKSQIKRRITMISLFKKTSFKVSVISMAVIVGMGGVMLTNSKASTIPSSNKKQVTENTNVAKVASTEEKLAKDTTSPNAGTSNEEKKQGSITAVSDSKVVADTTQTKQNISNKALPSNGETGKNSNSTFGTIKSIDKNSRTIGFDDLELITADKTERMKEIGITDKDFSNWYLYNASKEIKYYKIKDSALITIYDKDYNKISTDINGLYNQFVSGYENHYDIKMQGNYIVEIVQKILNE